MPRAGARGCCCQRCRLLIRLLRLLQLLLLLRASPGARLGPSRGLRRRRLGCNSCVANAGLLLPPPLLLPLLRLLRLPLLLLLPPPPRLLLLLFFSWISTLGSGPLVLAQLKPTA